MDPSSPPASSDKFLNGSINSKKIPLINIKENAPLLDPTDKKNHSSEKNFSQSAFCGICTGLCFSVPPTLCGFFGGTALSYLLLSGLAIPNWKYQKELLYDIAIELDFLNKTQRGNPGGLETTHKYLEKCE